MTLTFTLVLLQVGKWVTTSAPARIDLAGGWTDTPPVSYEFGGVVVNAAILVDGERALSARVRRIAEPVLSLRYDGQDEVTVCTKLADLEDYSHPLAHAVCYLTLCTSSLLLFTCCLVLRLY